MLTRLDADKYSSEDLVVLAVPISLPYPIQQNGYERVNGEFEYQGEYYNLVKQRLENDTLFMVCIRDKQEKRLANAFSEYTNLANSLPTSAKHTIDLLGKLFKDYTSTEFTFISTVTGWFLDVPFAEKEFTVLQRNYPIPSPPPKA